MRVDPDWLTYLVQPMLTPAFVGSGGPNVVPPDDPFVAQCVARAPGGPTQVLLDDRVAEHVPGCNMAFRRDALAGIGGFNPVYLRAGDDVDVCWRLQAKGCKIGFAPSALVWHHHRSYGEGATGGSRSGYGEGETWLDAHHPEKFIGGQMLWRGRIYSPLPFVRSLSGRRINTGVWGTAAFPGVYRTDVNPLQFVPHSASWMAASTLLCVAGVPAAFVVAYPVEALLLLGAGLARAGARRSRAAALFAARSDLVGPAGRGDVARAGCATATLIAWLHLVQPVARVYGRIRGMWSPPTTVAPEHVTRVPWKAPVPSLRDAVRSALLLVGGSAQRTFWSERWASHSALLTGAGRRAARGASGAARRSRRRLARRPRPQRRGRPLGLAARAGARRGARRGALPAARRHPHGPELPRRGAGADARHPAGGGHERRHRAAVAVDQRRRRWWRSA